MSKHPEYDPDSWGVAGWCAFLTKEPVWQRGLFWIDTRVPEEYREAVKNHYRTVLKLRRWAEKNRASRGK